MLREQHNWELGEKDGSECQCNGSSVLLKSSVGKVATDLFFFFAFYLLYDDYNRQIDTFHHHLSDLT